MTKFILHGGATGIPSIRNKNFFVECLKFLPEPIKILTIYFARQKEEWQGLFENDKKNFSSNSPDKQIEFILAEEEPEKLKEQIEQADVIYIRGGNDLLLQQQISKIKNLSDLLKNKVVVGSSAGANLLAEYYYTNDGDRIEKGFGILPIKVFCHYSKEEAEKLKQLQEYGKDLKLYAIPETQYVVIEV